MKKKSWDITPVTDICTYIRKVEQYSVWAESAINSQNFENKIARIGAPPRTMFFPSKSLPVFLLQNCQNCFITNFSNTFESLFMSCIRIILVLNYPCNSSFKMIFSGAGNDIISNAMIPGGRVWLPADRNGRKQGEIKSQDKWKWKENHIVFDLWFFEIYG